MTWALIAAGVVVALIGIVLIVGSLLPRDHVVAMSARINGTPDAVWGALVDVANYPAWRPDVTHVDVLPPTASGQCWRETSRHGRLTMTVDRADAPRTLVTRIADTGLPYGGSWEFHIEPDGPGSSTVTITEHGSVYNPLFRFVSRFIMGHTATLDGYLRALGKRFGNVTAPALVAVTGAGRGF